MWSSLTKNRAPQFLFLQFVIVPLSILFKTFKTAVIYTFQGYWKWNFTVRLQCEGCYSILLIKSTTEAKHSTTKLSWLAKIVVTSGVVRAIRVTKASECLSTSAKAVFCNYVFCSFHPSHSAADLDKDGMQLCACANDDRADWLRAVRHDKQWHARASDKQREQ